MKAEEGSKELYFDVQGGEGLEDSLALNQRIVEQRTPCVLNWSVMAPCMCRFMLQVMSDGGVQNRCPVVEGWCGRVKGANDVQLVENESPVINTICP